MALIVSTGFVVDDTIVVLENVTRHLEEGHARLQATLKGAREVGFTVLSMSISLIAVFLPILLMGGIVGPHLPRIRRDPDDRHRHLADRFADRHADDVRLSRFQRPSEDKNWLMRWSRARPSNAARISTAAPWPGRWTIPRPSCSSCSSRWS